MRTASTDSTMTAAPEEAAGAPPRGAGTAACIFSIDVEDWFHILDVPSAPPLAAWSQMPSRVEANFRRLLEILADRDVRATCFFLGWVAEHFPHLVRAAVDAGHEIASHGFAHQLVYEQTREAFAADVGRARDVIEQASGQPVRGYRSPGFSCTADTPWFFEVLAEAGYRYDSSVFPAARGHGGMRAADPAPHVVQTPAGALVEVPISVAPTFGRALCFFGGGYLRLFPYGLIERKTRAVLADDRPVVFYIHPREIDPGHPRLAMSPKRRFKTYVNLAGTETKLRRLLGDFEFTTFHDYLHGAGHLTDSGLAKERG